MINKKILLMDLAHVLETACDNSFDEILMNDSKMSLSEKLVATIASLGYDIDLVDSAYDRLLDREFNCFEFCSYITDNQEIYDCVRKIGERDKSFDKTTIEKVEIEDIYKKLSRYYTPADLGALIDEKIMSIYKGE